VGPLYFKALGKTYKEEPEIVPKSQKDSRNKSSDSKASSLGAPTPNCRPKAVKAHHNELRPLPRDERQAKKERFEKHEA